MPPNSFTRSRTVADPRESEELFCQTRFNSARLEDWWGQQLLQVPFGFALHLLHPSATSQPTFRCTEQLPPPSHGIACRRQQQLIIMNATRLELYEHPAENNDQVNGMPPNLSASSNSPSDTDSAGAEDRDGTTSRKRKRFSWPMNVTYVVTLYCLPSILPFISVDLIMHLLTTAGA